MSKASTVNSRVIRKGGGPIKAVVLLISLPFATAFWDTGHLMIAKMAQNIL